MNVHPHSKLAPGKSMGEPYWTYAGCKRFDGALKGIGGCPMAADDLVGNMNTEWMLDYFKQHHLKSSFSEEALEKALLMASDIFI